MNGDKLKETKRPFQLNYFRLFLFYWVHGFLLSFMKDITIVFKKIIYIITHK